MRCVYIIKNLINQKVYIGQTKNFANRKAGHLYAVERKIDRPLYRSINKHGVDNFLFEIIENDISDETINEHEQFWVLHNDSFNPEKGYNLTSGGNQGMNVSEETRKKLSEAHKGKKLSQKHIDAIKRGNLKRNEEKHKLYKKL